LGLKLAKRKRVAERFKFEASKMANSEVVERDDEAPLLEEGETSRPRRIALFVEPSPFALVSFHQLLFF